MQTTSRHQPPEFKSKGLSTAHAKARDLTTTPDGKLLAEIQE